MTDYKFLVRKPGLKSSKTRKKFLRKFLFVFLLFCMAGGGWYGYKQLKPYMHSPFYVKTIEVIDAENVNMKKLNKCLERFRNKPFSIISFSKLAEELTNIEWIKDVVIHKNYPSTLIVELIENSPIGILNCNDKFYLIGDNGKIIRNFSKKFLNKGLFIFSVKSLTIYSLYKENILNIYKTLKENNIKNVSEVLYGKEIEIFTYNPHRKYIVSIENFQENIEKIKLLKKAKKKFDLDNLNFKEVNLKFQNKIFIKL